MIAPDDLLDAEDLARVLGITRESLAVMRSRPDRHPRIATMPPPLRTVSGRPVWRRADIDAWLGH